MEVTASVCRIRVEFHVARLGHALPRVHLLDSSPQVVPDLVQADLSQSMRILGPVRRHVWWWELGGGLLCPLLLLLLLLRSPLPSVTGLPLLIRRASNPWLLSQG